MRATFSDIVCWTLGVLIMMLGVASAVHGRVDCQTFTWFTGEVASYTLAQHRVSELS